jgi:hypothetical protein
LIFEDRDRLTVVAEIAHIRSGSPKGPRHDPRYPDELVNEEENLLLLCGTHHKPVDDHESVYPVSELLEWKRRQVAAAPERDLSEGQVAQIVHHYDLNSLGPDGFEKMCQALAVRVLGPGTKIYGGFGPDGGRDAAYQGRLNSYPTANAPWDGYVVMQAMFKPDRVDARSGSSWLRGRIGEELRAWSPRSGQRNRIHQPPQYLIFASNVSLSPALGGGIDAIDGLITASSEEIGLKDWAIWGEDDLACLLDMHPDVRHAFSGLISSRNSVAQILAALGESEPTFESRDSEDSSNA